jgi:aspartate-semialdehyde dehydrogenase
MKVAVIGATGLVGQTILNILEERNFPVSELIPVASSSSVGKKVVFKGKNHIIQSIQNAILLKPQIAIFSAGGSISRQFAPEFAKVGAFVIDNSSAWRMDDSVPLIVPEINAEAINRDTLIIANPNCSTIQFVLVLDPLEKKYGLERVVISTYQAVSGTGKNALDQMFGERNKTEFDLVYPHPIDLNCFPHGGDFLDNGNTTEEAKLIHETRKILELPNLRVSPTVVRIPVHTGHSESVNIEFKKAFDIEDIRSLLSNATSVQVNDDPASFTYPTPLSITGSDDAHVGRIRRDESLENGLNLWISADNLRVGAATNAIRIAEYLVQAKMV